ncbi:Crp/Fnr family transcriptional regulator [Roseibacterium beibuensis]|nr:Crp/Fnr family transcriptional regulator [Roseibacterium beibuensis]
MENQLLRGMGADDRQALLAHGKRVSFSSGEVYARPDDPISTLAFVEAGVFASSWQGARNGIDAYLVGHEGVVGIAAWAVASNWPAEVVCRSACSAWQIPAVLARDVAWTRPGVRASLGRYAADLQHGLEAAVLQTSEKVTPRLASLLLALQDRMGPDNLTVTQEMLAEMLGIQRTSVCGAARDLKAAAAITFSRGRVWVIDRTALEAAAGATITGSGEGRATGIVSA